MIGLIQLAHVVVRDRCFFSVTSRRAALLCCGPPSASLFRCLL